MTRSAGKRRAVNAFDAFVIAAAAVNVAVAAALFVYWLAHG